MAKKILQKKVPYHTVLCFKWRSRVLLAFDFPFKKRIIPDKSDISRTDDKKDEIT